MVLSDQRQAVNKNAKHVAENNHTETTSSAKPPILQRFGGFRDHGDTFLISSPPPVIPGSLGFSRALFQQMLQCFDPRLQSLKRCRNRGCHSFLACFPPHND